ncbi:MAG: hypothetical protein WCX46_04455 [Candidatus Paceibacterota bacterium]
MEEFSKIEDKEEVPQIHSKTGISQDYANQINGAVSSFNRKGLSLLKDKLKERPFHIKKYEEAFSEYKNIVNEKNREGIQKLNELSLRMNDILKDPDSINEDSFRDTCNEIYSIIYGDRSIEI